MVRLGYLYTVLDDRMATHVKCCNNDFEEFTIPTHAVLLPQTSRRRVNVGRSICKTFPRQRMQVIASTHSRKPMLCLSVSCTMLSSDRSSLQSRDRMKMTATVVFAEHRDQLLWEDSRIYRRKEKAAPYSGTVRQRAKSARNI